MPKKLTHIEFVKKSKSIHGEKYEYIEEYKKSDIKIKIRCKKHDYIFNQKPNNHLRGQGCPICGKNIKLENKNLYISKFREKHGNKYDYKMENNKIYSTNSFIKIKCKKHNYIFNQKIFNHLSGTGCKKCAVENDKENKKMKLNNFLIKSNKIHNNKFDYSLVKDLKNGLKTKISIICKKHGVFEQKAGTHLRGKICCPNCKKEFLRKKRIKEISKNKFNGFQVIPNFNKKACEIFDKISELNNINIQHAMNNGEFHIKELGYWVDGYDKENNVVYEFDEKKHFDSNKNLKKKDLKRQKEIENYLNCKFIRIKYNDKIF
jgi:hypothetical protein